MKSFQENISPKILQWCRSEQQLSCWKKKKHKHYFWQNHDCLIINSNEEWATFVQSKRIKREHNRLEDEQLGRHKNLAWHKYKLPVWFGSLVFHRDGPGSSSTVAPRNSCFEDWLLWTRNWLWRYHLIWMSTFGVIWNQQKMSRPFMIEHIWATKFYMNKLLGNRGKSDSKQTCKHRRCVSLKLFPTVTV